MSIIKHLACAFVLTAVASPAFAANLPDGTYTCKSGYGTSMMTPGYIEVRGSTYRFHESGKANDQPFKPYVVNANGIVWQGPMGFMTSPSWKMGPTRFEKGHNDRFYWDIGSGNYAMTVNCGR